MKKMKWLLCSLGCAILLTACEDSLEGVHTPTVFNYSAASEDILLTPCDKKQDIAVAQIPESVQNYLSENYPGLPITEAERYEGGFLEVELADDIHVYFGAAGEFLGDDEEEDDDRDRLTNLLNQAKAYLRANYPDLLNQIDDVDIEFMFGEFFLEIEFDEGGEMVFSQNGELLCSYDDDDDRAGDDGNDDDDGEHVDPSQLPQAILDYIAANYPDATITKAELDDGKYEVYLSNGLELYFSLDGTFIGLNDDDDDDDEHVDPSQLPQAILDYIAANYPDATITKAELDDGKYEVYLSNGLELYFSLDGTFIGLDDDDDDDDEHVDPGQLPQAILDYIAANYPDATITKAELDDGKYEVYLSNGLELYFSLDGTFIGLDDDDDDDDEHVDPSQLPQAILDYIAANYPDATITKAELDDGKYEVYLSNGLELYFSLDGTFIGLDDDDDGR